MPSFRACTVCMSNTRSSRSRFAVSPGSRWTGSVLLKPLDTAESLILRLSHFGAMPAAWPGPTGRSISVKLAGTLPVFAIVRLRCFACAHRILPNQTPPKFAGSSSEYSVSSGRCLSTTTVTPGLLSFSTLSSSLATSACTFALRAASTASYLSMKTASRGLWSEDKMR